MTKILSVFLGVFLFSAIQAVMSETVVGSGGGGGKFVLPLSSSVRSLSLHSMIGKWYEVASSRQVQKIIQKDCQCLASTFTMVQKDKLHIMNECLNKTTNHAVVVNGTLRQVMVESYPGAFCMEFESESKVGANVLDSQREAKKEGGIKLKDEKVGGIKDVKEGIKKDVKEGEIKKDSKEGVKDIKGGGIKTDVKTGGDIKTDIKTGDDKKKQSKELEEKTSKKEELARVVKEKNINFLVLKNVEDKALLISGSSGDLIWVLSRTPTLDDSIFRKFNDKAKGFGFEPLVKGEPCATPTEPVHSVHH